MKATKILKMAAIFSILLGHSGGFAQNTESKIDKKLKRNVSVKTYTDNTYPPSVNLEVYKTNKPERPYTEIAQIETYASRKDAMKLLTAMAKKLGGDAIIMAGEENRGAIAIPIGTMVYAAPVNYLVAIVIKFKK